MLQKRFKMNLLNFRFSLLKNSKLQYIYIYNKEYFIVIMVGNKTKVSVQNNKELSFNYDILFPCKLFKSVSSFVRQFGLSNFSKIKFSGKGYKIKKDSNSSVVLLFNRSHTTKIWWRNLFLKKLKKYKLYINYTKKNREIINKVLSVRYCNIFTKKGLRKSRQVFLKKKGKK